MRKAATKTSRVAATKRRVAKEAAKARSPVRMRRAVLRSEDDPETIDVVLLKTARKMLEIGLMDRAGYEKITMRHLKKRFALAEIAAILAGRIRVMRERARMSQRCLCASDEHHSRLRITTGAGLKQPGGTTLKLLSMIHRKGINALL